ncbi:MAG TPA: hypothetical protein VFX98_06300, partial [Longimicrobiaceae bacterium]|nr:hypothetical protein [Longimicrobiaceae bacterium]
SFLARALGALLEHAARQARSTVRVVLALEPGGGAVLVRVEHDGRPGAAHAAPGAATWLVAQLGGELRPLPAGGANPVPGMEIRLPAAAA